MGTNSQPYLSGLDRTIIAVTTLMIIFHVSASVLGVLRVWRTVREQQNVKTEDNQDSLHHLILSQGFKYLAPVFVLSISSFVLGNRKRIRPQTVPDARGLPLVDDVGREVAGEERAVGVGFARVCGEEPRYEGEEDEECEEDNERYALGADGAGGGGGVHCL
ncbi:hypothetical protein FA15DRAFT_761306 [Coprinopsis marcescibilis]|uniref:Uncharacterized protein n=1 Tax=Coprinopsis marcescibilis TaxID=230819 RepID=A0A5C3KA48_COPMA|nr:hypothetical protein FA15DRAFT_761306 [Coprinopsis marcescibilis]